VWRDKFGGYTPEYYLDILWGVLNKMNEVALLCRDCHDAHHEMYGFAERQEPTLPKRPKIVKL